MGIRIRTIVKVGLLQVIGQMPCQNISDRITVDRVLTERISPSHKLCWIRSLRVSKSTCFH